MKMVIYVAFICEIAIKTRVIHVSVKFMFNFHYLF